MVPAPLFFDPIYDGSSDPTVIRKESNGKFYIFYTQRRASLNIGLIYRCYGTAIAVAESDNGSDWHYLGTLDLDFEFGGKYWLIADMWDGLTVYSSDDLEHFTRQPENILREPGTRKDDGKNGNHADVYVVKGRAYILYFTMPFRGITDDTTMTERCRMQMAELKVVDGKLVCDRDADFDVDWI